MARRDDFFNPRRKPTQADARVAVGLARTDRTWRGDGDRPLSLGARPHPLFSNLTQSEIDMSLALLDGTDEFDPW
jgi:hypothetical protein